MPEHTWHPTVELERTAQHDDAFEAAEDLSDEFEEGGDYRVVVVEYSDTEEYTTYIEERFESGSGWVSIGTEAQPDEDYIETIIDMFKAWGPESYRLIYDYTNGVARMEEWHEDGE